MRVRPADPAIADIPGCAHHDIERLAPTRTNASARPHDSALFGEASIREVRLHCVAVISALGNSVKDNNPHGELTQQPLSVLLTL
jgi:hypothetical protein